jgi:hypothetical protein
LQFDRGQAGPQRLILLSQRRAKNGQDGITLHTINLPAIHVHGSAHQLDYWREEIADLLDIEVQNAGSGSAKISKQNRGLFAFVVARQSHHRPPLERPPFSR